jgi:hypothetical protein
MPIDFEKNERRMTEPRRHSSILLAVLIALNVGACRSTGDPSGPGSLVSGDIVGTWTSSDGVTTTTMEFRADGTRTETYDDGEGPDSYESRWEADGDMLVFVNEESGSDDGCSFASHYSDAFTTAIVDETLFMFVYLRTNGSGGGLDGTWTFSTISTERHESSCEGESYSSQLTYEHHATLVIEGEGFELTTTVREAYDSDGGVPEDYTETWTDRGTLRIDGETIYSTATEQDGEPIPEDEQYEELLGTRAAPDVIATNPHEVYHRQ